MGEWKTAFLFYALPLQIICLAVAIIGVPSTSFIQRKNVKIGDYLADFRKVFGNLSAVTCILGFILSSASWQTLLLYGIVYIRQVLQVSRSSSSLFIMVNSLIFIAGNLTGGKIVSKFGRKTTTLISILIVGLFVMLLVNLNDYNIYFGISCLGSFMGGVMFTAIRSLTVEQIPELRGTVMSLGTAGMQFGYAISTGIGGLILIMYNFQILGLVLGGMGVIGAVLIQLFAIDPTRK
jgi:DHA1 family putative efflux transporter-like MFS transporter